MFRSDPRIDPVSAASAWSLQASYPLAHTAYFSSPALQFARRRVEVPRTLFVPTRHGPVRTLVYAPSTNGRARWARRGRRPPVHLAVHGGAFIVRMPEQEDNVARWLASEVGCYVVVPDYLTAPEVCHPVAEQQVYDVFRWVRGHAAQQRWDGSRISVGGPSAGTKLAISVIQQSLDDGLPGPVALASEYGTVDLARSDARRRSAHPTPVVTPALIALVRSTYFAGVELTDPFVSPYYDTRLDRFPPTLVITAQYDTLRSEMREFADALDSVGVPLTYRQIDGVDHGFTHMMPARPAREALGVLARHLRSVYAADQVAAA